MQPSFVVPRASTARLHGYNSVVIADRHPVVLLGLSSVLDAQPDFRVVARCTDKKSFIEAVRLFTPDIAIVDVCMPGIGSQEIHSIATPSGRLSKATRVVLFTASADEDEPALTAAGAYGVITKDTKLEILVQALRQIACGPDGRHAQLHCRHWSTRDG
jgi:two-component system nitrate/nitrite response regulator NarL